MQHTGQYVNKTGKFLTLLFVFCIEIYKSPSNRTVTDRLRKRQVKITEEVKQDLSKVSDLAVTHDSWTSLATESYSCVTAHFVKINWELRILVMENLNVTDSHTSKAIADGIQTWIEN